MKAMRLCNSTKHDSPFSIDNVAASGVLLKIEVGIRKGAWRMACRYPAYLWSLRWVYAVKKTRRLVYGVYPRIPPPNTPLVAADYDSGFRPGTILSRQRRILLLYDRRVGVPSSRPSLRRYTIPLLWRTRGEPRHPDWTAYVLRRNIRDSYCSSDSPAARCIKHDQCPSHTATIRTMEMEHSRSGY